MMMLIIIVCSAFVPAMISGIAGFGGALILLPVLTCFVGIHVAIPVLTIGQIFGNASRVWFGRKELRWKPILLFLLTALPFTVFGSVVFAYFDGKVIQTAVGVILLAVVINKRTGLIPHFIGLKGMPIGGMLTGFISGVAGSAGPLGAAFFLGLNLPAVAYIASEAVTALCMHLVKVFTYHKYEYIGTLEIRFGLLIGLAMILGSWVGNKTISKIPSDIFPIIIEVLLVASGVYMIIKS